MLSIIENIREKVILEIAGAVCLYPSIPHDIERKAYKKVLIKKS